MPVTELQVNFIYVAHFIWHVYFMYFSTKQKKKKKNTRQRLYMTETFKIKNTNSKLEVLPINHTLYI